MSTSNESGQTDIVVNKPNFEVNEETVAAYENALSHMKSRNYAEAIFEMQKVASMDERISGPWVNIGVAQKQLGDLRQAEIAYEKAISINPKNHFALNNLAILNRENGQYGKAERLYKKALSARPDYKNAHLNLAILCDVYLRKIDCALEHYQQYLDLSGGQDKQVIAWMAQLESQGS